MSESIRLKSIGDAHKFLGIDKPKHPLVSVLKGNQLINHEELKDIKFVFDLFQVSLKVCHPGSFRYGRNTYDFEEGSLIFSKPGQVMEFDNVEPLDDEYQGWVLAFHPDLIRKSELGDKIDNYSFFSYESTEALHLSDEERKSLEEIIRKIEEEINQSIDRYSQDLIISNIKLLLDYCTRYFDRQFYTRTNLNKDVFSKFESLLKSYYKSEKPGELGVPTVKYFGNELGMSPYYLSDLLKKETGRNTMEHIHFFIIDKAKTRLLNSTESVREIAYELGFEYPQHFAKVFKNKTGMSPSEYRKVV